MPIVRVEIARGVASVDQKKAVIRRMTDVLVEELGRDPEYVFVVIDEVDTDNWGERGCRSRISGASATPRTQGKRVANASCLARGGARAAARQCLFCVHKTLRVTPAMEAGLTDHVWGMEEIVAVMDERAPKPGRRGPYKKRGL